MDAWRLILHPHPGRGAWNMAVDEALLESAGRGRSLPTLRLYAWEPACISLGYAQPVSDVDLPCLSLRGWDLVRRPTGGRAVLHVDELTYSVAGPLDEPRLAGSVLESYNRLAAALTEALRLLGLKAEIQQHSRISAGKNANPVCFEMPSTYEITVGGKKLVGSAQARRKDGMLQHGSLPLVGDLTRILQALSFQDEAARQRAARRLLERATTVESAIGQAVAWDEAARAFLAAFRSVLELDLRPGDLTPEEHARAGDLMKKKYAHPDWTGKRA
jgi:lipoate-protein ligase A